MKPSFVLIEMCKTALFESIKGKHHKHSYYPYSFFNDSNWKTFESSICIPKVLKEQIRPIGWLNNSKFDAIVQNELDELKELKNI